MKLRLIGAAMAIMVSVAGCGLDKSSNEGATVESQGNELAGANLTVGSKDFDESIILGYLTKYMLEAHGAKVAEKMNMPAQVARTALLSGDINMYWDYTGTGWIEYLRHSDPITDPQKQYEAVRDEDLAQNKVAWTNPAPLNSTYAIAVKAPYAEANNLKALSDIKGFLAKDPSQGSLCTESEFTARNDGLPGLEQRYGFKFANVKPMATGVAYTEQDRGNCNFAVVYGTDGRIKSLNLVVLEDDLHFFPIYNASLLLRAETDQQYPYIRTAMDTLAPLLTDQVIQELNERVTDNGEPAADVALDFLKSHNLVK